MRAFAASQFTLQRFGVWRAAVLAVTLLVVLTIGTWLATRTRVPGVLVAAGIAAAVIVWLCMALLRAAPLSLRWDTQRWHLGPADTAGQEPWAGELNVVIDLGSWMLLRFRPDAANSLRAARWLPVQRGGLEAQWHALRCAVYSPRPAAGLDAEPDV